MRCTIYIVRRTQLYLDDPLWEALHALARNRKTTISELMREAARERYLGRRDEQRKAMQQFVGSGKRASDTPDSVQYIRDLRRSDRLDRLRRWSLFSLIRTY
jgi:Ribbon-helix-helix protein, copG family